jgi:hypothetical protein
VGGRVGAREVGVRPRALLTKSPLISMSFRVRSSGAAARRRMALVRVTRAVGLSRLGRWKWGRAAGKAESGGLRGKVPIAAGALLGAGPVAALRLVIIKKAGLLVSLEIKDKGHKAQTSAYLGLWPIGHSARGTTELGLWKEAEGGKDHGGRFSLGFKPMKGKGSSNGGSGSSSTSSRLCVWGRGVRFKAFTYSCLKICW